MRSQHDHKRPSISFDREKTKRKISFRRERGDLISIFTTSFDCFYGGYVETLPTWCFQISDMRMNEWHGTWSPPEINIASMISIQLVFCFFISYVSQLRHQQIVPYKSNECHPFLLYVYVTFILGGDPNQSNKRMIDWNEERTMISSSKLCHLSTSLDQEDD